MLPFLKAPADAPLMTDKHEIDARYRYWRRHILLTIWLGYALFYFTRKSFNAAVPEILANGVLSRSDIGLLATLFYITYGVSKFVSGIVSDRSNARYFMGIGLIATGIINILFGFSTSLWAFAVLWVLNAFFQGWGSPVCARLLTAWYSRTERGGWWALWNTAHNVGGALIPIVMAAAECSHKEAAGAATGFVGLFAYLGASLAGWPLAKVLDTWHWSGFFVVISIAAGISALLLLPFLNAQAPREA
ncbi:TPA: MFS transporter [Escherichia coli]